MGKVSSKNITEDNFLKLNKNMNLQIKKAQFILGRKNLQS